MILAVVAIVLALIALAMNFVIPGPTGPAGSSSTGTVTFFAAVTSTGTLARGTGVNTTALTSTGHFTVAFDDLLTGCTFTVAIGDPGAGSPVAASATVTANTTDPHAVDIATFNAIHTVASEPFHVVAFCPAGLTATVLANGTLLSGTGVHSSILRPGVGSHYVVLFDQTVSGCAYISGLGTGGTPPAGSVTVATRAGNASGIWVDTYNATGASTNESFHVTVYC